MRSIATMSRGSSTTQTTCASRRSSRQNAHSSPSAMLKHRRHHVTRSFASTIARGEPLGVLGRRPSGVERDALRRLRADAGQPPELVDERLDRSFVERHGRVLSRAAAEAAEAERAEVESGRSRRRASAAGARCAWRVASVTAATTRSSSVSTSSGSTTLGSIEIATQLAVAGDRRLHDAAADRRLDARVRERFLRGLHVGLHLLDLLEHLHRVCGSSRRSSPVTRADVLRRPRRRGR